MLTKERAVELLNYDKETGVFTWKVDRGAQKVKGKVAGCVIKKKSNKYIQLRIDSRSYHAHRVAWLIIHGVIPDQIDHINGDGTDNRIVNIRDVTKQENAKNRRKMANNTTGACGVTLYKRKSGSVAWQARVTMNRKSHTKTFDSKNDAIDWRLNKLSELNFHKNHGSDRKQ